MKITQAASTQIDKVCATNSWFRIHVQAGGCSGFQHEFQISDHMDPDEDHVFGKVVIDHASYDIIQNAQLDYKVDLSGSQFTLSIPEATSECGCGKSFSLF